MESEGRIRALASLDPLFALRYSATHRNPYNLVYRLTPFEAYRQSLVKKIEVASVVKEDDFNQVFVRVDEIRTKAKTVQAKIAVHQRMAGAGIKEKAYFFKPGDCLESKATVLSTVVLLLMRSTSLNKSFPLRTVSRSAWDKRKGLTKQFCFGSRFDTRLKSTSENRSDLDFSVSKSCHSSSSTE